MTTTMDAGESAGNALWYNHVCDCGCCHQMQGYIVEMQERIAHTEVALASTELARDNLAAQRDEVQSRISALKRANGQRVSGLIDLVKELARGREDEAEIRRRLEEVLRAKRDSGQ